MIQPLLSCLAGMCTPFKKRSSLMPPHLSAELTHYPVEILLAGVALGDGHFRVKLIAPHCDTRIAIEHEYTPKPLLSRPEAILQSYLDAISQNRCRILVKPRLADVFQHAKGDLGGFNGISQKHVDFLICRNDDWMPMMGIELDDSSHERADRKKRDMFVNAVFASAGVPLLRIHVREIDRIEQLVQTLTKAWHHRSASLEA